MSLRLVDYSSDEEQSLEEKNQIIDDSYKENVENTSKVAEPLPLPFEIKDMFCDNACNNRTEDPSIHGGKIRSFPHERGVWATHVFIEYIPDSDFCEMVGKFQDILRNHSVLFEPHDSFHISLSKTVKLRHHFIDPFIEALKTSLKTFYRFQLRFDSLEVYENEEKTRTFLGLKINYGHEALTKLVKRVDSCLADFQLPCFYEDPSFHLSFASCVGSKSQILESHLADLNVEFQIFVKNNPCFRTLDVSKIKCKSGNKLFTTSLIT